MEITNTDGLKEELMTADPELRELARGLERMALFLDDATARLVPSDSAREAAAIWLRERGADAAGSGHLVALHPGSGSAKKNWPARRSQPSGRCQLHTGFSPA